MNTPKSLQPCSSSPIKTLSGSAERVVLPVPDKPKKRATSSSFEIAWFAEQCIGIVNLSGSKKFKRVKTGPLPYNVEYQLQALKCKPRALGEDELALIADLKSMDEVMPRPTPDAQKELLDRIRNNGSEEIDETLEDEFNVA